MCGRFSLFVPPADVEERFGVALPEGFEPTYNAAPGQRLPVVTNHDPDAAVRQTWGFVPSWADDGFSGLVNARAETAADKPAFRDAYRRRRCYVLADGFYEWAETDGGKRPYRVEFADRRPFAMAGLWERRTPDATQSGLDDFGAGGGEAGNDGGTDRAGGPEARETFAVLTTEPNDLLADYHDRMPVLLDPDGARAWLESPDEELLTPASPDDLRVYPVSSRVNSPANDDPGLVEPVEG